MEGRAWNEPAADFGGFDAVVLRSNWDYHFEPEAFLAWLDRLERAGARIFNPPALVRWNVSKRYLIALQAAGVPTVATVVLEDETRGGARGDHARHGWRACVLKPEIGASAHDTRLVTERHVAEAAAAIATGAIRRPVLVQPFVEEVRTRGEWSLVFIEGRLTHSVLKRPAAGDFRVQSHLGGTVRAEPAPPGVVRPRAPRWPPCPAPALRADRRRGDGGRLPDHGGRGQRARPLLHPRAGRGRLALRGGAAARLGAASPTRGTNRDSVPAPPLGVRLVMRPIR